MQRPLAVLLILIGLIGLALGRLGETTWAPETETTATVALTDPGSAVVIDPGVLYVGGTQGQVVIEGASDVSVITAANGDIDSYLEGVRYTRITGASDWTTLSTQEVNPDGAAELTDPTTSDLWRSVETKPSPYTIDVADFWAGENGENEQVYRSLLIVTDGTAPGADKVSITWPVDAENAWVPFAYAGGAAVAVIGLVLLVVSIGSRRRDEDEEWEIEDGETVPAASALAGAPATDPADAAMEPATDEPATDEPGTDEPGTDEPETDEPGTDEPETDEPETDEPVAVERTAEEPFAGAPAEGEPAAEPAADENTLTTEDAPRTEDAPLTQDDAPRSTGSVHLFGDDEERR